MDRVEEEFFHQLLDSLPGPSSSARSIRKAPHDAFADGLSQQLPSLTKTCSEEDVPVLNQQLHRAMLATRAFSRARVVKVYANEYSGIRGIQIEKILELDITHGLIPSTKCTSPLSQSMYFQPELHHFPAVHGYARLRDQWESTFVKPDDTVHLIGEWDSEDGVPCMILSTFSHSSTKESARLLVVHPDVIISSSRLASVASCMRKSMLQERIRSPTESTYVAVLGTMVHSLLQACLTGSIDPMHESPAPSPEVSAPAKWDRIGNFSCAFITAEIERQLEEAQQALVLVDTKTDTARRDLIAAVPSLVRFAETFLSFRDDSRRNAMAQIHDTRMNAHIRMCITRIIGTESDILCPMYGLKGRLDLCLEAEIETSAGVRKCILPMEVKTGRITSSMEHTAQTSLYTMILADAYGVSVDYGLLFYVQNSEIRPVHRNTKEVRSLIMARNEMASFKVQLALLPSPTEGTIDILPQQSLDPAHVSAPSEPAEVPTPASEDSFEFDLTEADLEDLACDVSPRFLPPTIDNKYKCQRCYSRDSCMLYRRAVEHVSDTESPIADLYADSTDHLTPEDMAFFAHWDALLSHEERGLLRFQHELWTMPADARAATGRCVPNLMMIRKMDGLCAFSIPASKVAFMPEDVVCIAVQTPVTAFLLRGRVEASTTQFHVRPESSLDLALTQYESQYGKPQTFRVDLDDIMSVMGVPRYNLACLFYKQVTPQITMLRRRVVHLDTPQWTCIDDKMAACVQRHAASCNADQRHAIERALCARDYTLILGMPGTGKSTTIAVLVRILADLGQRVLLCSHTHSAVDTIVSKLLDIPVLRLGPLSRIHPRVHACALATKLGPQASAEALVDLVQDAQIVAATCLATNDAALARRTFDVCIMDEASQITVPTCLGPLRLADRFVMIGDHHQLTPVVRNTDAASHGMSVSLFQRLCKAHPDSVAMLCMQYRMNAEIMALSNALVYEGRLSCGSKDVACARLIFPSCDQKKDCATDNEVGMAAMLEAIIDPSRPCVFVDTDPVHAEESRTDTLVENEAEAAWVARIIDALRQAGVQGTDVGVLTPYRQQSKRLRDACASTEVLTIDQAQGRDWPVVLVSLVRSNTAHVAGELLRDRRRVNVMVTRAKTKLILVGSQSTMAADHASHSPMRELVRLLDEKQVIVSLHKEANKSIDIPSRISPRRQRPVKKARGVLVRRPVLTEVLHEHGLTDE